MRKLPTIKKICENCGKEFEVPPYYSYVNNCSKRCGQLSQAKKMKGNTFGFEKRHKINKDRLQTDDSKEKISITLKKHYKSGFKKILRNELHGKWKGDKASYQAIHVWVRKNKPKPDLCEHCNQKKTLEIANISGKCLRDINDYLYLCRRCHMIQDGRLKV